CEWSGHQAVFSIDISVQGIFLYQETRVRASAFNRDRPSIAVVEEEKFQHGTLGPRLNVLDSKIPGASALGEPAQLPRRIDHHRTFHSVHVKQAAMALYLVNAASLFHACMSCHDLIQHSARNAQAPPLKWELDFRGSGAYARRSHFNSACVQNLIDETELAQTIDRTWRKKTATDFWTWKPVAFQSYSIDAHALQSPHTSGACKASTDNDHVVHAHFSATSTRRYGKLL